MIPAISSHSLARSSSNASIASFGRLRSTGSGYSTIVRSVFWNAGGFPAVCGTYEWDGVSEPAWFEA